MIETARERERSGGENSPELSFLDLVSMVGKRWRMIVVAGLVSGVAGFGAATLIPSWYTASTLILPPQQQQSAAASAITQLGALAGLSGGLGNMKSPAEQYATLLMSSTVSDRLIEKFGLQKVYDIELRDDTRRKLRDNVNITVGKKDGMLTIEVEDRDPRRAADIANAYVAELRQVTNAIAVSEAQQRRVFFEQQLTSSKERLAKAQAALEGSGITPGVLQVEPKLAAERYAMLSAQATAAELRLLTLRRTLVETTPEVAQQQATLNGLRELLARAERQDNGRGGSEYIGRYREFKYQEALFEIFVKQYEMARLDESREGALIQVVDIAQAPERRTGPKRAVIAVAAFLAATLLATTYALVSGLVSGSRREPLSQA